MRLKIATTISMLLGVVLLFAWPLMIGPRPAADAGRQVLARYAAKSLVYFGLTCLVFLVTAWLAVVLMRQMREQFAKEARENLHSLVEGSLRSHAKPEHEADDAARN